MSVLGKVWKAMNTTDYAKDNKNKEDDGSLPHAAAREACPFRKFDPSGFAA